MIRPSHRVALLDRPERKGLVVQVSTNGQDALVYWDGLQGLHPVKTSELVRLKNTLVTIGCLGNRIAYLNLSVEEATRRFLARENEHVYHEEDKKTALDTCDRVSVMEFDDEFSTYE